MSYTVKKATYKCYNMHHVHHKRESFIQRMRDAFKAWARGNCYTSKEIHTPHGFGYAVCESCYNIERALENKWRNKQNG